jgi:hypothetical protein
MASATAALETSSSARRVAALSAAMAFGASGPWNIAAYCLKAAALAASPAPAKSSCLMRRVVARCDTGTTDLSAACLRLLLEGSAEADRLQPRDGRSDGALSAGGGGGRNSVWRKLTASFEFEISRSL